MMARGVLAGANKPTQELTSKSGTPFSMNVATSGKELARLLLDTAMGSNLPDFTWGMAPAMAVYTNGILPPKTSVMAWPPPL